MNDDTRDAPPAEANQDYSAAYAPKALREKIAAAAKLAGKKLLRMVLTLYYCLQDPDTPAKAKGIIVAALGYFIVPLDAIPDIMPGAGYSDDLGALALAFAAVLMHIKQEHRQRAMRKLEDILGTFPAKVDTRGIREEVE